MAQQFVHDPATAAAPTPRVAVELNGINVIAEEERKGTPRQLFWPWFGANVSVLGLAYGSFVLGFGISFWQAVIAGVIGIVVSFLLCGLVAIAAQIIVEPNAAVPTVGASGAVAAVLGGYILLYPRARVVTLIFIVFFFTILELPAVLILGFWFLEQVAFGAYGVANPVGGGGGGVAYFAHIGGFAFGLLASAALPGVYPEATMDGAAARVVELAREAGP